MVSGGNSRKQALDLEYSLRSWALKLRVVGAREDLKQRAVI